MGYLWLSQSSEGEHADLLENVFPCAGGPVLLDGVIELLPHPLDARGHPAQLVHPFGKQLLIVQHRSDDASAPGGRVGVHGSHDNLQLTDHSIGNLWCLADHAEATHSFTCCVVVNYRCGWLYIIVDTIKAKVLGIRLRGHEFESATDGNPYRCRISVQISCGEALIGRIEERKQFLLL